MMIKYFKILFFLFVLSLSNNVNAKPVPPGAGGGDVAANILFLVDSSASMGRWIGGDGIGPIAGVTYDSENRILMTQYSRRTAGAVIRYALNNAQTPVMGLNLVTIPPGKIIIVGSIRIIFLRF